MCSTRTLRFAFACLLLTFAGGAVAQRPDVVWMRGGHIFGPNMFDFFPDSARFITGGEDCTLKIFRVSDGNLLRTIPVDRRIWRIPEMGKLSPDGSKLALFTEFNSYGSPGMSVWDMASGTQLWPTSYATGAPGYAPMWSADGTLFGTGRYVIDAATGAVAWDPGRTFSDMARDGGSVVSEGYITLRSDPAHPTSFGPLNDPIFSPDYTTTAGGAAAAIERTWVPSVSGWSDSAVSSFGRFPAEAAGTASYGRLLWPKTDDGSHYFFGVLRTNDSYARLLSFDTRTLEKKTLASFTPERASEGSPYVSIAATRDGQLAAIARAGRHVQLEGPVKIVKVADGEPKANYASHVNAVMGVAYSAQPVTVSPGEKAHIVASVSWDRTARIWNAATGAPISTILLPPWGNSFGMGGIALSPDGRAMAAAFSTTLTIHDISDLHAPVVLNTWEATSTYSPVFSPDGQFLAFIAYYKQEWGSNTYLVLYQKQGSTWVGKSQVWIGDEPYGSRPACAFSPDSKFLAAGFGRSLKKLRVPDLSEVTSVYTRPEVLSISYSADGKRIALGTQQGAAAVYDASTLSPVWSDPFDTGYSYAIAIDPCNETFTYGIQPTAPISPGKILIRKLSTGALLKTYDEETGLTNDLPSSSAITLAAFCYSPDGQFITYARNDSSLVVMKNPLWKPAVLTSVTASPATIAGGNTATGTVTLDCPAPIGDAVVTLSSSNATLAAVPSTVTIPVGKKSATFPITTAAVAASTSVTITAKYNGVTKTKIVTLMPPALSSLTVSPTSVVGGAGATGTVKLTGVVAAGTGGIVVSLSSNNGAVGVPGAVTVLEGAALATFPISTTGVAASTPVTITAAYNGVTKTASLTVNPPALSTLTLSATSVIGATRVTGNVKLSGLAAVDTTIAVSSANAAAHPVPPVVVAAGSDQTTFTVTTDAVSASTAGAIKATLNGVSKSVTLTVKPPTFLTLNLAPNPVVGGNGVTGTVTMSGPVAVDTTFSLTNANTKAQLTSSTVTIPAGQSSSSFAMTTQTTTVLTKGVVKATLGSVSKSVTLSVTP